MKINGIELEDIDMLDADVMEDVENAIADVIATENSDGKSMHEIIRSQCTAIMDCFNTIWGTGTDKKIFGDRVNLRECLKALEELKDYVTKQMDDINKEFSSSKVINRADRRK